MTNLTTPPITDTSKLIAEHVRTMKPTPPPPAPPHWAVAKTGAAVSWAYNSQVSTGLGLIVRGVANVVMLDKVGGLAEKVAVRVAQTAPGTAAVSKVVGIVGKKALPTEKDVTHDETYIRKFAGGEAFYLFLIAISPTLVDAILKLLKNIKNPGLATRVAAGFVMPLGSDHRKDFLLGLQAALTNVAANLVHAIQTKRQADGLPIPTIVDVICDIGVIVAAEFEKHRDGILKAEQAGNDDEKEKLVFLVFEPLRKMGLAKNADEFCLKGNLGSIAKNLIWPQFNSPTLFLTIYNFFKENGFLESVKTKELEASRSGTALLGVSRLLSHKLTYEILQRGCTPTKENPNASLAAQIAQVTATALTGLLEKKVLGVSDEGALTFSECLRDSLKDIMVDLASRKDGNRQKAWIYIADRVNFLLNTAFYNLAKDPNNSKLHRDPFTAAMHSLRTLFLNFYQNAIPESDPNYRTLTLAPAPTAPALKAPAPGRSVVESDAKRTSALAEAETKEVVAFGTTAAHLKRLSFPQTLFTALTKALLKQTTLDNQDILCVSLMMSPDGNWLNALIELLFNSQPGLSHWINPEETIAQQLKNFKGSPADRDAFRELARELTRANTQMMIVPLLENEEAETKVAADKQPLAESLGQAAASGFVRWLSIPQTEAIAEVTLKKLQPNSMATFSPGTTAKFAEALQTWIGNPDAPRIGMKTIEQLLVWEPTLKLTPDEKADLLVSLSKQLKEASYSSEAVNAFTAWATACFKNAGQHHSSALARQGTTYLSKLLANRFGLDIKDKKGEITTALQKILHDWLLKRAEDPVRYAICPDLQTIFSIPGRTEDGSVTAAIRELQTHLTVVVKEVDPYLERLWKFTDTHIESTLFGIFAEWTAQSASGTSIRDFTRGLLNSDEGRAIERDYDTIVANDTIEESFRPWAKKLLEFIVFNSPTHVKWTVFNLPVLIETQIARLLCTCYGEIRKPQAGIAQTYRRIGTLLFDRPAFELQEPTLTTDLFDQTANLQNFISIFATPKLIQASLTYFMSDRMVEFFQQYGLHLNKDQLARLENNTPIADSLNYLIRTTMPKFMANIAETLKRETIDLPQGNSEFLSNMPQQLVNSILDILYKNHPQIRQIEDDIQQAKEEITLAEKARDRKDEKVKEATEKLENLKLKRNAALHKIFFKLSKEMLFLVGRDYAITNKNHPLHDFPFVSEKTKAEFWSEHLPTILSELIAEWYNKQPGVTELEKTLQTRYFNSGASLYNACLQRLATLKHSLDTVQAAAAEDVYRHLRSKSDNFFKEMQKAEEAIAQKLKANSPTTTDIDKILETVFLNLFNQLTISNPTIVGPLLITLVSTYKTLHEPHVDKSCYQRELAKITAKKGRSGLVAWAAADKEMIPYLITTFVKELDQIAKEEEERNTTTRTLNAVSSARALHRFLTNERTLPSGKTTNHQEALTKAFSDSLNNFAVEAASATDHLNRPLKYALDLFENWTYHYLERILGTTAINFAKIQELEPDFLIRLTTNFMELTDEHVRRITSTTATVNKKSSQDEQMFHIFSSYAVETVQPRSKTRQYDPSPALEKYKQLHPAFIHGMLHATGKSKDEKATDLAAAKFEHFYKPLAATFLEIFDATKDNLPLPKGLPDSTKIAFFNWFKESLAPNLLRNLDQAMFAEKNLQLIKSIMTQRMDQKINIVTEDVIEDLKEALKNELGEHVKICGAIVQPLIDATMDSFVKFFAHAFVNYEEISQNFSMSLLPAIKKLSIPNDLLAPMFKLAAESMHPGKWERKPGTHLWQYQPTAVTKGVSVPLPSFNFPALITDEMQRKALHEDEVALTKQRNEARVALEDLFKKIINQSVLTAISSLASKLVRFLDKIIEPILGPIWVLLLKPLIKYILIGAGAIAAIAGCIPLALLYGIYKLIVSRYAKGQVKDIEEILSLPINESYRMQMMTLMADELKKAVKQTKATAAAGAASAAPDTRISQRAIAVTG